MTRKDYIKIAECINTIADKETLAIEGGTLVVKLARIFKDDNPDFNRDKFFDACMKGGKQWKL